MRFVQNYAECGVGDGAFRPYVFLPRGRQTDGARGLFPFALRLFPFARGLGEAVLRFMAVSLPEGRMFARFCLPLHLYGF